MNPDEQKIEKYTAFLEKNPYSKVRDYLDKLKIPESDEFMSFYSMVYEEQLLLTIERQKVALAQIISSSSKAEVLPEDRSRLIYLLANCAALDLTKTNQSFEKEFGPGFRINESYMVRGKRYGWQKLAIKAKEIKNGLYNCCYLASQDLLDNIIEYYKLFPVNDINRLIAIDALANEIITDLSNDSILTPIAERAKPLMNKIERFYSATNRLKIDIDKLKEEVDFDKIKEYILTIHMICSVRISLSNSGIQLDRIDEAEKLLLKYIGRTRFMNLLSVDELERFGKPLTLVKNA